MGLPGLQGHDKERVAANIVASEFNFGELKLHQSRGGTSGRVNLVNSLHWHIPTEVGMSKQGTWCDRIYDAGSRQGARRKKQKIAMMSRKSDSGQTCAAGMSIIHKSGHPK